MSPKTIAMKYIFCLIFEETEKKFDTKNHGFAMDKPPVRGYALHGFMAVTSRNYPLKNLQMKNKVQGLSVSK